MDPRARDATLYRRWLRCPINPDLEARVKGFVANERGVDPLRIKLDTTLFGDLGTDGADGWELIEAFGKEFEVDRSGFDWSRHFGPEAGCNPFTFIPLLIEEVLRRRDPHVISGLTSITIRDLIEAAEQKTWLK
jgi:hypothetical protein